MLKKYKLFWRKAFDFSKRSRRIEFLSMGIPHAFFIAVWQYVILSRSGQFWLNQEIIFFLVNVYASLAAIAVISLAVRRLHDTGRSGLWLFLSLSVIGLFVVLYWLCLEGDTGSNQYGENPEQVVMSKTYNTVAK